MTELNEWHKRHARRTVERMNELIATCSQAILLLQREAALLQEAGDDGRASAYIRFFGDNEDEKGVWSTEGQELMSELMENVQVMRQMDNMAWDGVDETSQTDEEENESAIEESSFH
jgi:hypothetical protein